MPNERNIKVVGLSSADIEWQMVLTLIPTVELEHSLFGEDYRIAMNFPSSKEVEVKSWLQPQPNM